VLIKSRPFDEGSEPHATQPPHPRHGAIHRAEVASRKAALERARAPRHAAKFTADRTTALAKIDAVSTQEAENAVAALEQAIADVAAAEAALRSEEHTSELQSREKLVCR